MLANAAEARARGRGSTTRSWPQSRRCGARRSARPRRPAHRRRRRRQHHEPRRCDRATRRPEDARLHRGHRVARLHPGRPPEDRRKNRRHLRRRDLARGPDEDLRRARLQARKRVSAPVPVYRRARPEGRRRDRGKQHRASARSPTRVPRPGPRRRTSPPCATGSSSRGSSIPLVVGLMLALVVFTLRSLWSLRSNKALVARLGDFVTLPAEEQCRGAAAGRSTTSGHGGRNAEEAKPISAGWKALRRTWMSHRSITIRRRMVWASVLAGLLVAAFAGVVVQPVLDRARDHSVDRPQPRGAGQGAEGPEGLRRSSYRRISTCSHPPSGPATASQERWAWSPTRRRSRPSASSAVS